MSNEYKDIPDGEYIARRAFAAGISPPPRLKVWEWADRSRYLSSKESPEHGRWHTSRVPYSREIMECLSPQHPCHSVTFMKSVQTVGTECLLNWLGWFIDTQKAPFMVVMPTIEMAERFSKQRLTPMIHECPSIKDKIGPARSRDSGNTVLMKEWPGGVAVLAGANSATSLRSMPAAYVAADEVDAYPIDLDGEGDPLELAEARGSNFSRFKIFKVSTPTIESLSRINKAFLESDQRHYHIPCPHCGGLQALVWEQLSWPTGHPQEAKYLCIHCGKWIEEHHKSKFLPELGHGGEARWIPSQPGPGREPGFHINSLYAPIGLGWSWGKLAARWEKVMDDPVRRKTFENTRLGICSKDPNEKLDHEELMARASGYPVRTVPSGCLFITAGVDVQKDRFAVLILGHGRGRSIFFLDYTEIEADPTQAGDWLKLEDYLLEPLFNTRGRPLNVSAYAVDAGYLTDDVLNYTRARRGRCIAVKGASSPGKPVIAQKPGKTEFRWPRTSTITYGAEIWTVGTDTAKDHLFSRLQSDRDKMPDDRMVKFPGILLEDGKTVVDGLDESFYLMLTAEIHVTTNNRWVKIRPRNEALDCHNYALAAALQPKWRIHQWSESKWAALEASIEPPIENVPEIITEPVFPDGPAIKKEKEIQTGQEFITINLADSPRFRS